MAQKTTKDLVREAAESDLEAFIRLVHPLRVLGAIHQDIIRWWYREGASTHQLLLMPRDHQKSALVAYRVAWEITRNPSVRVLYISATANLAQKQLKFIKDILTSDIYRRYWPEMVAPDEGKREKWTESEISVDHPARKLENIRDPSVFTAGLTTTITGLHCDIQVLDDVVVKENAYTEEGRAKVEEQYSLLASIASGDAQQWIVGTRYHPKDLYNTLIQRTVDLFSEDGDLVSSEKLYEVFRDGLCWVENRGDGTGEYLWPAQQRTDGKWFGFNQSILARKRAQYLDKVQFRAQYYNDPNSADGSGIDPACFQYYDRAHLSRTSGAWFMKGRRLNVFAAMDFAYTVKKSADYTTIVVVGIDSEQNYYVLDIDRFKTGVPSEYFKHLLHLHQKWDFRKVKAEVTAAQEVIVNSLKHDYIRVHGLALSVEHYRPTRNEGNKEERIAASLQPRYADRRIWHYHGGLCQVLEEELTKSHPGHDDIKDALATAVDACVAPTFQRPNLQLVGGTAHSRFGGVA